MELQAAVSSGWKAGLPVHVAANPTNAEQRCARCNVVLLARRPNRSVFFREGDLVQVEGGASTLVFQEELSPSAYKCEAINQEASE